MEPHLFQGGKMDTRIQELEQCLQNLTRAAQALYGKPDPDFEKELERGASLSQTGWWVLVRGDRFDAESLPQREQARENLRKKLLDCAIKLAEYIWVWDESCRAQVVVETCTTRDKALERQFFYEILGFETAIVREKPGDDT